MNRSETRRDSKKSLLCVYYPQQLLPALAAVLSFRRFKGEDLATPFTVFVWTPPGTDLRVRKKRLLAFEVLLHDFAGVKLCFPEPSEIKAHLSQNAKVLKKAGYLRNKFGPDAFDAIYYAHDISADFIAQSAMQAFPKAERICFGDALGVLYSNKFFTGMTYPMGSAGEILRRPDRTFRNILYRLKRAWILPSENHHLEANYVVPILPCDPGGDFIKGKNLLLVDENSLCHVKDSLSNAVERFLANDKCFVNSNGGADFLMLLGSYSESRLTTEEQERELYVEVARQKVSPGSRIALKPHPISSDKKIERIQRALSMDYEVCVVRCGEMPIEAMPRLVENTKVISFSYSSVSLCYLYNSTVLHALNDSLIKKFFPFSSQLWMSESNRLYLDQFLIAWKLRNNQQEI